MWFQAFATIHLTLKALGFEVANGSASADNVSRPVVSLIVWSIDWKMRAFSVTMYLYAHILLHFMTLTVFNNFNWFLKNYINVHISFAMCFEDQLWTRGWCEVRQVKMSSCIQETGSSYVWTNVDCIYHHWKLWNSAVGISTVTMVVGGSVRHMHLVWDGGFHMQYSSSLLMDRTVRSCIWPMFANNAQVVAL